MCQKIRPQEQTNKNDKNGRNGRGTAILTIINQVFAGNRLSDQRPVAIKQVAQALFGTIFPFFFFLLLRNQRQRQVHPSKVIAWGSLGKRKVPLELILMLRVQQVSRFIGMFNPLLFVERCLVLSRYLTSLKDETVSSL